MHTKILLALFALVCTLSRAQQDSIVIPEPENPTIQFLVAEAMMNNPAIRTLEYQSEMTQSRIGEAGSLDPPELDFKQEGMPDFRYSEAMFSRIELSQMIPFPTKLGARRELAEIQAEHADHDRLEKSNEIISRLKSLYYQLWFIQQSVVLDRENERLMSQFSKITETRYDVGMSTMQNVLQARVELSRIGNDLIVLRQQELSTKAMMMAILNRSPGDTLGFAIIPDDVVFNPNPDSLISLAMRTRPMIVHDSLMIQESEMMRGLAKKEYYPDFRVALERMTSPSTGFQGWSVSLGISLPFAPWSLGKAGSGVEEADARIRAARSSYQSTEAMIAGDIRDLYFKAQAAKARLENYRSKIIPATVEALNASLTSYQTGTASFTEVLEAYRSKTDLMKEYFSTRMDLEQTIAMLEQEVGAENISGLH